MRTLRKLAVFFYISLVAPSTSIGLDCGCREGQAAGTYAGYCSMGDNGVQCIPYCDWQGNGADCNLTVNCGAFYPPCSY